MDGLTCDRCDGPLLVREDVRYEVFIRVQAAYDPMELNLDALAAADVGDELERLREAIERKSAEELEAEVYKEFRFDLCLPCQRRYLRDPLGRRDGSGSPEGPRTR
ncbi:MAG: hypothetical protein D6731_21765 [Planctomycetota bacterium]|nr:MAG: hypothetical protein D6731_21765 [Planctomycetota bacterium]